MGELIKLVTAQLGAGRPVGEIKVPTGDPDCKTNLFRWFSQAATAKLSTSSTRTPPALIVHCWKGRPSSCVCVGGAGAGRGLRQGQRALP